jgi:hypothetical protein
MQEKKWKRTERGIKGGGKTNVLQKRLIVPFFNRQEL